jgi:hypothetical protein
MELARDVSAKLDRRKLGWQNPGLFFSLHLYPYPAYEVFTGAGAPGLYLAFPWRE